MGMQSRRCKKCGTPAVKERLKASFQGQFLILPQSSKKVASAQSQRTPSQRTGAKKAPPALFFWVFL